MSLRWYSVVIDCHDIAAQARWWAGVLDWQIIYEANDEVVIVPRHVTEESLGSLGRPGRSQRQRVLRAVLARLVRSAW